MGLPWSRFVPATDAPIAGPFFIAGDGSPFRSLSPSQVEEALSLFGSPQLKLGPCDLFFRFVVSGELAAVDGRRVTARRVLDLLGVCRLRIFEHAQNPGHAVDIATEMPGNLGPSITNAAATIATQVCARLALDPARLLFVEHYNDAQGERFALVSFERDNMTLRRPRWSHTDKATVEVLIGQPLK